MIQDANQRVDGADLGPAPSQPVVKGDPYAAWARQLAAQARSKKASAIDYAVLPGAGALGVGADVLTAVGASGAGDALRSKIDETVNPAAAGTLGGQVLQGIGASLPFAVGGGAAGVAALSAGATPAAAGLAATATVGGLGMAQAGGEAYARAKKAGASDDDALLAGWLTSPSGLTEIIPAGKWAKRAAGVLGRTNAATGGALSKMLQKAPAWLAEGSQEAIQETFQNYYADLIAQSIHSPQDAASLLEAVKVAPASFIAGAIFGGVSHYYANEQKAKNGHIPPGPSAQNTQSVTAIPQTGAGATGPTDQGPPPGYPPSPQGEPIPAEAQSGPLGSLQTPQLLSANPTGEGAPSNAGLLQIAAGDRAKLESVFEVKGKERQARLDAIVGEADALGGSGGENKLGAIREALKATQEPIATPTQSENATAAAPEAIAKPESQSSAIAQTPATPDPRIGYSYDEDGNRIVEEPKAALPVASEAAQTPELPVKAKRKRKTKLPVEDAVKQEAPANETPAGGPAVPDGYTWVGDWTGPSGDDTRFAHGKDDKLYVIGNSGEPSIWSDSTATIEKKVERLYRWMDGRGTAVWSSRVSPIVQGVAAEVAANKARADSEKAKADEDRKVYEIAYRRAKTATAQKYGDLTGWKKGKFKITGGADYAGPAEGEGLVHPSGLFALHNTGKGEYSLTHTPSGYAAGHGFTQAQAKELANRLVAHKGINWKRGDINKQLTAKMAAEAKAITEAVRGGQFRPTKADIDAEVEAAWEEFRKVTRGKAFSTPLDPEVLSALGKLASAYIKRGVHSFKTFVDEAVRRFGEAIRPHAAQAWKVAKDSAPEADRANIDEPPPPDTIGKKPTPEPQRGPNRSLVGLRPETGTEKVRRIFQDKNLRLRVAEKEISGGKSSEVSDAEIQYHGKSQEWQRKVQEVQDLFTSTLKKHGISLEEGGRFLIARHAADRDAAIYEHNGKTNGSGMEPAEAERILKLAEKNPGYQELAEINDQLVKAVRDKMEANGLISHETRQEWEERFGDTYTPLKDEADDQSTFIRDSSSSFNVSGPESERAEGRSTEADNPITRLLDDAAAAGRRAEKNAFDNTLAGFIGSNPAPSIWEQAEGPGEDVLSFKTAGEPYYIRIKDKGLLKILKNLDPQHLPEALSWAGKAGRVYSQLHTSRNPNFILPNLGRDLQSAGLNLTAEQNAAFAGRVVKGAPAAIAAAFRVLRNGQAQGALEQYFREFRNDGGMIHWVDPKTIADRARDIERDIARTPVVEKLKGLMDAVDDLNHAVENGVRLSTYVEARKEGMSRQKSAVLAKEVTVNFAKKGEAGPVLNAFYLFFSARANGAVRTAQVFKHHPKRAAAIAGSIFAAGFAMSLINRISGGDDDKDGENWWSKRSAIEKSQYWMLQMPGGKAISIALTHGWGLFFHLGTMAEHAINDERMTKGDVALSSLGAAANALSPVDVGPPMQTVSPWFLDPIADVATNKDFAGRPVYKERFPGDLRPYSQVTDKRSSATAKAVSAFVNEVTGGDATRQGSVDIPPGALDKIAGDAGGGLGRFFKNVYDSGESIITGNETAWRNVPIVTRFLRDEPITYAHDFYDVLERIKQEDKSRSGGAQFDRRVAGFKEMAAAVKKRVDAARDRGDEASAEAYMAAFVRRYNERTRKPALPVAPLARK